MRRYDTLRRHSSVFCAQSAKRKMEHDMSKKTSERDARGAYYVPTLMDGYQVVSREEVVLGPSHGVLRPITVRRYYLQQLQEDGETWRDVRGPYKQSANAKEWLRRKRFRDLMAARKRGDDILFPSASLDRFIRVKR